MVGPLVWDYTFKGWRRFVDDQPARDQGLLLAANVGCSQGLAGAKAAMAWRDKRSGRARSVRVSLQVGDRNCGSKTGTGWEGVAKDPANLTWGEAALAEPPENPASDSGGFRLPSGRGDDLR